MITAGCDVGSLTAKAVIMNDDTIMASYVIRAKPDPEESAREVMLQAVRIASLSIADIEYCVGTGYGKKHIPFVNSVASEIACHGRGGLWAAPSIRTIIDIGGQDAKAIRIDETGNIIRYAYNDKCASGTGRFLEIIADALELSLEELGAISQNAQTPMTLSSQCVVFAETEIISLVNDGRELPDIINALHQAVASRAASLALGIGIEKDVAMSGGVAKNRGMFQALKKALRTDLVEIAQPQINGAIGAALIAQELNSNAA